MTKRLASKHKIERRYGIVLWGQGGSPVHSRNYPPGQHGTKGTRRKTQYGQQVAAKQQLKGYYGNIGERQFRNIYKEASRRRGDTGENLLDLLERRLDAVIYRLKFVPTVFAARQMVNHGHILVNGKKVDIPSFRVKDQDVITLKDSMRQNAVVMAAMASSERAVPEYIEHKAGDFSGKFLYRPDPQKIPYPVQMQVSSVVEYYSR